MSVPQPFGVDTPGQHMANGWHFVCPVCRPAHALERPAEATPEPRLRCLQCHRVYRRSDAIWRFLPDERLARYASFLREYHTIRRDQGWGRPDAGYFLALPAVAADDPQRAIWRRRSESYQVLRTKVIAPVAERLGRPLRILDLGAGNCWLAYRLTALGHQVAAVDLSLDVIDGLGAHRWYAQEFDTRERSTITPLQADFNDLPLPNHAVDVALFNASLHYSTACDVTLREALRVLAPEGVVIIMDSPVYQDTGSGEQMVREREAAFERTYGFRSDSLPAEQFLTWDRLARLARALGLRWQICGAVGGWSRAALAHRMRRRWRTLQGRRELAGMPVIVGLPR